MFQFNKKEMEKVGEPIPDMEETVTESEVEAVNLEEVPKPRQRSARKKPKPKVKRAKKVLSEEFDIVEDEYMSGKVEPPKKRKPQVRRKPAQKPNKSSEGNFNSDEYHKKRHDL
jgi:hypothetical protein